MTKRERAMAEWCTCSVPFAGDCVRHDTDENAPTKPPEPDTGLRYRLSVAGDPRWKGYAEQFPDTNPDAPGCPEGEGVGG